MKAELLGLLACPDCGAGFGLDGAAPEGDEVETGALLCAGCGARFPVVRGVPRFGASDQPADVARTVRRFGYQWQEFREQLAAYHDAFLDWVQPLRPEDFAGRVVLDAGCGMGRFAAIAASFGARAVVGVDLSDAVEVAGQAARRTPNLHVVQADLRRLPFRRCFDLAYSLGVLHHLPDGEEGLAGILRALKPGARVHVWVYGHEGNEWLLRWVDPVRRAVTARLPPAVLRLVSFAVSLPLHLALVTLYRPAARGDGGRWLPYAPYLKWLSGFPLRHTHQVVFDHLGAPIAHYLRREELVGWFERAGLRDVLITPRNANSWRGTAAVS